MSSNLTPRIVGILSGFVINDKQSGGPRREEVFFARAKLAVGPDMLIRPRCT